MAVITKNTLPVVDRIRDRMHDRGLSLRAAAAQLEVSAGTVKNWIDGNTTPDFTSDNQRVIAKFLETSPLEVAELFGYDVSSEALRPFLAVNLFAAA